MNCVYRSAYQQSYYLLISEESGSVSESSPHLGESIVATHGSVQEEQTPTDSQDEGGAQEPELHRRDLTGMASYDHHAFPASKIVHRDIGDEPSTVKIT